MNIIEVMKQALEALEGYEGRRAKDILRQAIEQAEKVEPVAWLNPWRKDQVTTDYDAYGKHGIPLYTRSKS